MAKNSNNNSHKGQNWPYHEDKHGNMVPCASNPCSLHGGSDIMATSPEEATAKKYETQNAWGIAKQEQPVINEEKAQDNVNNDVNNTIIPDYESDHVKVPAISFQKANEFFDYINELYYTDGSYSLDKVNMLNEKLKQVKIGFGSDRNGLANAFIQRYDAPFKGHDFEKYKNNEPKTDISLYTPGERIIVESGGIGMGPIMNSYESVVITGIDKDGKPGGVIEYVDNNGNARWAYPEQIQAVQGFERSFARSFENNNNVLLGDDKVYIKMRDSLDFRGDIVKTNTEAHLRSMVTWNGKWMNGYVMIPPRPARISNIVHNAYVTGDYSELEKLTGYANITYVNKDGVIGIDSAGSDDSMNADKMMRRLKEIQHNVNNETYHPTFTKKSISSKIKNQYPAKTSGFTFKPADSSIIKPPVHNDNNGYMGGSRFEGGKYAETYKLPRKEVAKLMRADVKALKKNSSLPKDWKVSIRQQNWSMASGFDVTVSAPADSTTPAYRTPTFDDYMHNEGVSSWMKDSMESDGLDRHNLTEDSYNAFINDYNAKHPGSDKYRIMTEDARNAMREVDAALSQYGSSDTNGMVDYFDSHRMPSFTSYSVRIDK